MRNVLTNLKAPKAPKDQIVLLHLELELIFTDSGCVVGDGRVNGGWSENDDTSNASQYGCVVLSSILTRVPPG